MSVNTILVIDDEAEFRKGVVDNCRDILPETWELIAPDSLTQAMESFHTKVVRIVFLDRNLSSEGYQPLDENGRDYRNTSGIDIARFIGQNHPTIRRIAFSKGGLGCAQFNGNVEERFILKEHINKKSETGDKARTALKELILKEISQANKADAGL